MGFNGHLFPIWEIPYGFALPCTKAEAYCLTCTGKHILNINWSRNWTYHWIIMQALYCINCNRIMNFNHGSWIKLINGINLIKLGFKKIQTLTNISHWTNLYEMVCTTQDSTRFRIPHHYYTLWRYSHHCNCSNLQCTVLTIPHNSLPFFGLWVVPECSSAVLI